MIGMSFASFLTLLILGFIGAVVMHYGVRYKVLRGFDGFIAKWIAGWIGGWLASPVLGHWAFRIENVYVIPGIIGAFVGAFLLTMSLKSRAITAGVKPEAVSAPQLEMRKAG
jgi:uncharacterized membrane protein YeaQ/YmgE (transglycosylase-associated protein family)